MIKINIDNWERINTYNWFKSFSNSTYGVNVELDVTNLVKRCKETKESFFINMLYIIMNGLNNTEELRMRLIDDEPYLFDDINPAFTVLTKNNTFENVRFKNTNNYHEFYETAHNLIEKEKNKDTFVENDYNPTNIFNEYYITCTPWLDFVSLTHPIPDDKSSQCVPRICWGKYHLVNDRYKMMLNITVSHIFVDGYHLSNTFTKIQELLDNIDDILKD